MRASVASLALLAALGLAGPLDLAGPLGLPGPLGFLGPQRAHAQDAQARWRNETDAEVLRWVAHRTRDAGSEVLFASVEREDDGAARVVQRGVWLDGERAAGVFERRYRAEAYALSPVEGAARSPEVDRCAEALARCDDGPRACTREARACVFGRQVLARGDDAELILERPVTPMEAREGRRPARLRWQGHALEIRIPTDNAIDTPHEGAAPPELRVGALSRARQVLDLRIQAAGQEDPPRLHRFFLIRADALREIRDPIVATFGRASRLPGDGTIRIDESPWEACDRLDYPERAWLSQVVVRVTDAGEVRSATRRRLRDHTTCEDLPACPFVDRIAPGGTRRLGEILRDVRDAPALQTLGVGEATPVVSLRIAEEMPEVTHLDAVWLEVGGRRIRPRECERGGLFCGQDGASLLLARGDVLELTFDVPPELQGQPARLAAHGMYVRVSR